MTTHHSLPHEELTGKIIGIYYDVLNELGSGFPEFVMRRATAIALADAGLQVIEEVSLPVWFRGRRIVRFQADMLVENTVLVEVKISERMDPFHQAQLLHYLKATDLEVGILLNYGRKPEFKRVIYERARTRERYTPPASINPDT